MATLLKIQTSLFQGDGQSSQLAEQFARNWQARNPDGRVVARDLAAEPVPHLDAQRFQAFITPPEERTAEQREMMKLSDTLVEEIATADVLVLGAPMYNFSIPSTLRAYFDHIARAGVTFRYTPEGPQGLLKNKKAYVFVTRGGFYGGEDHSQSVLLRQFLGFLGITDVAFVHAEGMSMEDAREKSLTEAREKIAQLV